MSFFQPSCRLNPRFAGRSVNSLVAPPSQVSLPLSSSPLRHGNPRTPQGQQSHAPLPTLSRPGLSASGIKSQPPRLSYPARSVRRYLHEHILDARSSQYRGTPLRGVHTVRSVKPSAHYVDPENIDGPFQTQTRRFGRAVHQYETRGDLSHPRPGSRSTQPLARAI